MNSNNHNPGIVPGYYNPQQSKTEAFDYQKFLGTDFVDPTQIPMIPGDTQRPMQTPQSSNFHPLEQQIDDRVMPPVGVSTGNYQREMQVLYAMREAEAKAKANLNAPNRAVETIRIPIVIELTINLNISHVSHNT